MELVARRQPTYPPIELLLDSLAYLALSTILTWPLAVHPRTMVAGILSEIGQFVWGMHAAAQALRSLSDPLVTHELFAPGGAQLVLHTALIGPSLLLSPLTFVWGPVVAVNVWMFCCLTLTGICGSALARRLGARKLVAFWCGTALAFCPFMGEHLLGHSNLIPIWEILLAWLLTDRCLTLDVPPRLWSFLSWGFLLSFALLTDYQIALFAAVAVILAGLFRKGTQQSTLLRRDRVTLFLIGALFPLATLAWLGWHLHAAGGLQPIPGSDTAAALAFRVHLWDLLLRPHGGYTAEGILACCVSATVGGSPSSELTGYAGAAALLGYILAILLSLRSSYVSRTVGMWIVLAPLCAVLALGPTLTTGSTTVLIGGTPVILPYALLLQSGFGALVREPSRFILPMTISLVVVAAVAFEAVARTWEQRQDASHDQTRPWAVRLGLSACTVLLITGSIMDAWPRPFTIAGLSPLFSDTALTALRQSPPGIVLDLPTQRITGQWHIGCSYGTIADPIVGLTNHPQVGGYLSRAPGTDAAAVLGDPGLMALQPDASLACSRAFFGPGIVATPNMALIVSALQHWQVRYVLVTPQTYLPSERRRLQHALVQAGYGRLLATSSQFWLYARTSGRPA